MQQEVILSVILVALIVLGLYLLANAPADTPVHLGPGGTEWLRPVWLGPGGTEWPRPPQSHLLGPGGEQQHMV